MLSIRVEIRFITKMKSVDAAMTLGTVLLAVAEPDDSPDTVIATV